MRWLYAFLIMLLWMGCKREEAVPHHTIQYYTTGGCDSCYIAYVDGNGEYIVLGVRGCKWSRRFEFKEGEALFCYISTLNGCPVNLQVTKDDSQWYYDTSCDSALCFISFNRVL